MGKLLIAIEDDCEVMGNGLGSVAEHQYLPVMKMLELLQRHDVKMTFMVDVAHRLFLASLTDSLKDRSSGSLWDEMVKQIAEQGQDVQLHLHPQWLDAKKIGQHFLLSEQWNLGSYEDSVIERLVSDAVQFLELLLKPSFPDYHVNAFKAGSWGLQPFAGVARALEKAGISMVLGPRHGMYIPEWGVDYRSMPDDGKPYVVSDDVVIPTAEGRLLVVPLQPYSPAPWTLLRLMLQMAVRRFSSGKDDLQYTYSEPIPAQVRSTGKTNAARFFRWRLRPYLTHLKIGNQPYFYLRESFDAIANSHRSELRDGCNDIPVIIETHTKQIAGNFKDIDRFFGYLNDKYYDDSEFVTLTELNRRLCSNEN